MANRKMRRLLRDQGHGRLMIHQFKTDKLGRIAPLSEYEWDDEGVF